MIIVTTANASSSTTVTENTPIQKHLSIITAHKASSLYSSIAPTLLPENIASFITAIALAARLSLRCSSLMIEILSESIKSSTSFSLGLSRQAIINALSTAKKLHELTASSSLSNTLTIPDDSLVEQQSLTESSTGGNFLQVLDKYTSLGIYVVHHSFTLVELFALSGIHFASQSIKSGLMAAEESVSIIDGIFGSNESSRAIASIVTLVHRELMNDPDFELTKIGKMAILSGLTKAMTAFAVLQNVTHKRTMKHMKIEVLWKGLVVEEEENTQQMLIQYRNKEDTNRASGSGSSGNNKSGDNSYNNGQQQHTDIICELEEVLAKNNIKDNCYTTDNDNDNKNNNLTLVSLNGSNSKETSQVNSLTIDKNGNPYNLYKITTTTNRTTTRTTRIRPIDTHGKEQLGSKQITERTNEDENESFVAIIKPPAENNSQDAQSNSRKLGLKIILSSVSKKLSRKKVERHSKYIIPDGPFDIDDKLPSESNRPITTMTSTSTTTTSFMSSSLSTKEQQQERNGSNNKPPVPSIPCSGNNIEKDIILSEPAEFKSKRRMSWSNGLTKIKSLARKRSNISFYKNHACDTQQPPPLPPVPVMSMHKSNSTTSLSSSIARTLQTTTYYKSSSSISQQPITTTSNTSQTRLVKSPSIPNHISSVTPTHKGSRLLLSPNNPLDHEPNPRNFPRKHIIHNITHFMRYASAAYGESFMRILGIGDIPNVLPNSHHPNHHVFAHHTGVNIQDILLSSYTTDNKTSDSTTSSNYILPNTSHTKLHTLVHYVTVDHSMESIVLTCRGTLGLGDVLTDLTCGYTEFTHPADPLTSSSRSATDGNNPPRRQYMAHGGMLEAAQLLATQKSRVFDTIKKGLQQYPTYGLVLCGHSLGAGVASLLSVLWSEESIDFLARIMMTTTNGCDHQHVDIQNETYPAFVTSELSGLPAGRPIHCYTYGSPCVMSLELSQYCGKGLVTSVVHAFDIVSSLSLGLLRDFKNVAVSLHEDREVTDQILGRVIGKIHHPRPLRSEKAAEEEEENDQWFWALIKTMRADMSAEKLFPPSTIYLIESVPQLVQHTSTTEEEGHGNKKGGGSKRKHKRAHMVQLSRCDDVQARFSEIVFSRTMFMDHSPNMYEKAINQLNAGYFGR